MIAVINVERANHGITCLKKQIQLFERSAENVLMDNKFIFLMCEFLLMFNMAFNQLIMKGSIWLLISIRDLGP